MYSAVKVCLEFSNRFWPRELHGMICGNCFIPEFWFESPDRVGGLMPESAIPEGEIPHLKIDKKTYLVTAYACAKSAEKISSLSREEIIKNVLAQLDEIWGGKEFTNVLSDNRPGAKKVSPELLKNPPNPGTLFYLDAMVVDWGKNQYIRGGYSSPSFGTTPKMREIWQFPVKDSLYFVGEAFNKASIMTLHGAMETSVVAADHILKYFGRPGVNEKKSKL